MKETNGIDKDQTFMVQMLYKNQYRVEVKISGPGK